MRRLSWRNLDCACHQTIVVVRAIVWFVSKFSDPLFVRGYPLLARFLDYGICDRCVPRSGCHACNDRVDRLVGHARVSPYKSVIYRNVSHDTLYGPPECQPRDLARASFMRGRVPRSIALQCVLCHCFHILFFCISYVLGSYVYPCPHASLPSIRLDCIKENRLLLGRRAYLYRQGLGFF